MLGLFCWLLFPDGKLHTALSQKKMRSLHLKFAARDSDRRRGTFHCGIDGELGATPAPNSEGSLPRGKGFRPDYLNPYKGTPIHRISAVSSGHIRFSPRAGVSDAAPTKEDSIAGRLWARKHRGASFSVSVVTTRLSLRMQTTDTTGLSPGSGWLAGYAGTRFMTRRRVPSSLHYRVSPPRSARAHSVARQKRPSPKLSQPVRGQVRVEK